MGWRNRGYGGRGLPGEFPLMAKLRNSRLSLARRGAAGQGATKIWAPPPVAARRYNDQRRKWGRDFRVTAIPRGRRRS